MATKIPDAVDPKKNAARTQQAKARLSLVRSRGSHFTRGEQIEFRVNSSEKPSENGVRRVQGLGRVLDAEVLITASQIQDASIVDAVRASKRIRSRQ